MSPAGIAYAPGEKVRKLCLQEKLSILIPEPTLTKRTEIFGHCVHRKQFLVNNIKEQYTPPMRQQQQRKCTTTAEVHYQLTTQSSEEGAQRSFETLSNDHDDNLVKY